MNTEHLQTLPADWQPIARTLSAIGDEVRQRILLLFEPEERLTIKQISQAIGLSRSAVVHHLAILRQAEIMQSRKKGREVFFYIDPRPVIYALEQLYSYIGDYLNYPLNFTQGNKDG
ncbi:MAG: metalloregulator ArsR/SmtB family transcription factor [Desulfarculales bacterium]|jgi:DNA-binding transcriptional ArsR family regulator|nr:metalloregulator ArsR/SmtB family transcription factor [Desulfarculales bacterium]